MVQDADLILVGTFQPKISYPWFDGFRMGGTITAQEVLYGSAPRPTLELRYLDQCNWTRGPVTCDIRAWFSIKTYPDTFREPGLWFLKHASDGT